MTYSSSFVSRFNPPLRGGLNPGHTPGVTTPGSFANAPDVGGPLMFSSPDAPCMPAPSTKTAWDFLPDGWSVATLNASMPRASMPSSSSTLPNATGCSDCYSATSPLRHSATSGFASA